MAIVRTGVLWPTLVRWLVILIGGSSSEVHGRRLSVGRGSGEHVRARSQEIRGHRAQPSLGVGRCIAVQGEAASKQPVGLGGERRWVRLSARGEAQVVGGGRLVSGEGG